MVSGMTKRDNNVATAGRAVSDFPKHSFQSAQRVPEVIEQKNGGRPLPPAEVAIGLGLSPGSSDFRVLLSSSIKYGLTSGSYNQERVALTPLGSRIAAPVGEEDRREAIRTAILHNPTFRRILEHFNGKKLPDDSFFENVVVREFGVPRVHAAKCVTIFRENVEFAGLIRKASTGLWLIAQPLAPPEIHGDLSHEPLANGIDIAESDQLRDEAVRSTESQSPARPGALLPKAPRVFISHSKNKGLVDQIKTMLHVAEVPFDIAVEQETTAIPVPEKVFAAMRNCTAAIICVTADPGLVESNFQLNQNVLIEIGAAFVLYDKKVILVWDKRLPVPSNLQGLYRCEFEGNELSWIQGMKLMESVKHFKA